MNSNYDELIEYLKESYKAACGQGVKRPRFDALLEGRYLGSTVERFEQPPLPFEDFLDSEIESEKEIEEKARMLAERYNQAYGKAKKNTKLYLSLASDLDVYVATSMRKKNHFTDMATFCENIFKSKTLKEYDLRYFDPTISAADSHEDKGLIECLMVKSAKMLIYHTGDRESYGKDVEAAMALCLGKPTIFYCSNKQEKAVFYKDVHPLSRLVNFSNGVAGGVIVCVDEKEVTAIIERLFTNTMEYEISKKNDKDGYYLLKEKLTESVIRIQTNDELLTSVFWDSYLD